MRYKKSSLTTQYVIIMGLLLLLANLVLGTVLVIRSFSTTKSLIRQKMLSISKTASEIVDGDELASVTEADVVNKTPLYNKIKEQLTAFQKNADIKYIYAVKEVSEGTYVFTVDPDPDEPAAFGEAVVVTEALIKAGDGTAWVDDEKYSDRWGTYYSSYSPVYDSNNKITGVIGIDFDSKIYNEQVIQNSQFIIIISVLFVSVGVLIVFLINRKIEARFKKLNSDLQILSYDVDELNNELNSDRDFNESKTQSDERDEGEAALAASSDEIEEIGAKIHIMHSELKRYIEYTHIKSTTDALTSVKNSSAYIEKQMSIMKKIEEGEAEFSIAVFDINYLKQVNDAFGHSVGDKLIRESAKLIASVFTVECTYRIGGDEFAVISENMSEEKMKFCLDLLESKIEIHNKETGVGGLKVSLSYGCSSFDPSADTSYKEVFIRADKVMYERKTEYHNKNNG